MRRALLCASLVTLFSIGVFGQDTDYKLGIKVAPAISSTRTLLDDPNVTIDKDGGSMKLTFGLVFDKYLSENYVVSTGLFYVPKSVNISIQEEVDNPDVTYNPAESYKLQYLQIPATLKLFTNEVSPDIRVYFQLGMALEIKVYEEADVELTETEVVTQFKPLNLPVILGTGFEYRAGINTVLFGGISYQRGLTNVIQDTNYSFAEELSIRSTVFSIDLGVKF